ncbi:hypothetical protein CRG98_020816 [Punica granatum]|uniref:Uncharacterized protein n=1 Tax=Punica granatum TaxID=22663 RepID=A0A2I0JTP0_PUNGR|nr:hypothetical protein CRG98_020816 [Punica granatum]
MSSSGIVDKWTRKLREQGQSLLSITKGGGAAETEAAATSPGWLSPVFTRVTPAAKMVPCSETSLSMLVECFSP